ARAGRDETDRTLQAESAPETVRRPVLASFLLGVDDQVVSLPAGPAASERIDRDSLVSHVEDFQVLDTARRTENDAVAWSRLHQRACKRRSPADVVAIQIDLVEADDAYQSLGAG